MADGTAGAREIGRLTFTAEEIVRFAERYDPQPFHVDEAAARRSHFGALVASGWHTVCVWMGFFVRAHGTLVQHLPADAPAAVSPVGVGFGLKELRWPAPVRAGDEIVFFTEILEARPSGSRAGWTIYRRRNTARRADGTEVLAFGLSHMAPDTGPAPSEGEASPAPP